VAALAGTVVVLALAGGSGAHRADDLRLHVGVDESKHVETRKTIPITKRAGQKERVVASLSPKQLGRVHRGSSIRGLAEIEVSVTCLEPIPKCIGKSYSYSPDVRAQLVLAKSAKDRSGLKVGKPVKIECSQKLPNRNHHCRVVIDRGRTIGANRRVPCNACHLNVVMTAWHHKAKKGQVLVIGSDSDHGVNLGKASFSAANYSAKPSRFSARRFGPGNRMRRKVPVVDRSSSSKEVVVQSLPLKKLRRGEQLIVDARAVLSIKSLPYNVLMQPELIVARSRKATDWSGLPVQVVTNNGKISNENGANCTRGHSYFSDPCRIRTVGAVRIIRNARARPRNDKGPWKTLYVNLVVGASQEYGGNHHKSDAARIRSSAIGVKRYDARYSRAK
jgi:hypothetical protein